MTVLAHLPVLALPVIPGPRLPAPGEDVPPPPVVPGEVVRDVHDCVGRPVYNRPYAPPWALAGAEIVATGERIKYHRAPLWWRLFHRRPPEPTHLTPYRPEVRRG